MVLTTVFLSVNAAAKSKQLKRGVKEVVKAIRKNNKVCDLLYCYAAVTPLVILLSCLVLS